MVKVKNLSLVEIHSSIKKCLDSGEAELILIEAKLDPPAIEDALQSITTINRPGSATDVEAIGKP
jgi:hypothetical protein